MDYVNNYLIIGFQSPLVLSDSRHSESYVRDIISTILPGFSKQIA